MYLLKYFVICVFIISTFIVLALLIMCIITNRYWKRKGVFTLKPTLFFGNAKDVIFQKKSLRENLREYYDKLKLNGKRFGGYYFLTQPILVLSDVDLIKRIFTVDFNYFMDHPAYVNEDREPLSGNLFCLRGEKWKRLRMYLSPSFSIIKCKMMHDILLSYCHNLETTIESKVLNKEHIDLLKMLSKVHISMLGTCVFGLEGSTLQTLASNLHSHSNNFVHNQTTWGSILNLASLVFPKLLQIFDLNLFSDKMTNFFITVAKDAIKYRQENNVSQHDVMHLLLRLRHHNEITLNEVAAQCFVFLVAGYEPTSLTGTLCIYELSLNLILQENVRQEIQTVLQDTDGQVNYDALAQMTYLDQCIYETLRKYPPLVTHSRVCTQTYKIPDTNVTITKGTPIFVPLYGLHMDPEFFPNPDMFEPDRFSKENKSSRPPCSWMPFGVGPRMCIAYKFGLLQTKLVLVTLLRRYKFYLHPSTKIPVDFDKKNVILYPVSKVLFYGEKI